MMKFKDLSARALNTLLLVYALLINVVAIARPQVAENPTDLLRVGDKAIRINESIAYAPGFGNTFLVQTKDGNVIIDTSIAFHAHRHKQLLAGLYTGPIKYIILTHAHGDHTGGIPVWKEPGTQIIAQKNHVEFVNYQQRLARFFAVRNAAQFGLQIPQPGQWAGNYGAKIEPTILFDEKYEFELGGLRFELFHTPGETPDHLTVWIPQLKAAFTGDNYYESFPNIYTLRGTEPRWPLDYVNSLNRVLELKPEIVLPSHGPPILGSAEVVRRLTRSRDAIQYVHDEVVKGMNAGKDVFTLMREIKLPPSLDVGETYGKLTWSIRGIYEGYAGWFDGNPTTMYEMPARAAYPELVALAGGVDAVAARAEALAMTDPVRALTLTEVALAADPSHRRTLEVRLGILRMLDRQSRNSNERGWLAAGIRDVEARLKK